MQDSKINIAIDGHSSCGKSTLAKALAKALDYTYIDSGAMYRAVTLYAIQQQIDVLDRDAIAAALPNIHIHFEPGIEGPQTFLNGKNVEKAIRGMGVAQKVSPVAVIPAVRRAMVHQQQLLGKNCGVAMDGRDIGTVVFPDAAVKIFLTATMATRVERRYLQLLQNGQEVSKNKILKNLHTRDYIDSTRSDSPLTRTPGAIIIDNTYLSEPEQLAMVLGLVRHRIQK
ncbi:MAG: (d)CMP kinase [Bacteroidota bacterium]